MSKSRVNDTVKCRSVSQLCINLKSRVCRVASNVNVNVIYQDRVLMETNGRLCLSLSQQLLAIHNWFFFSVKTLSSLSPPTICNMNQLSTNLKKFNQKTKLLTTKNRKRNYCPSLLCRNNSTDKNKANETNPTKIEDRIISIL